MKIGWLVAGVLAALGALPAAAGDMSFEDRIPTDHGTPTTERISPLCP